MREMEVDWDEAEFVRELVESERITGVAAGIAKQAIDPQGKPLSAAQRAVFDEAVREQWLNRCCGSCGVEIPSSELSAAMDNYWCCSWCIQVRFKPDRE